MAIGTSGLETLGAKVDNIEKTIGFGNENMECIYSCWNTFQYVGKNLSLWADETTIGANVKQNITQLTNALYNLMQTTNSLNNKIETFLSNQKVLNGYSPDAIISGGREIANPAPGYH